MGLQFRVPAGQEVHWNSKPSCQIHLPHDHHDNTWTCCCRQGDVRMIEVLLAAHAKSIPEFVGLRNSLMEAAHAGHEAAVLALLKAGGPAVASSIHKVGDEAVAWGGSCVGRQWV